jgi:hypothetical protein
MPLLSSASTKPTLIDTSVLTISYHLRLHQAFFLSSKNNQNDTMLRTSTLVQTFLFCSMLLAGIHGQIRGGKNIESLRSRLMNAKNEALSRGEVQERFGVVPHKNSKTNEGRKLQETGSMEFMGIYNEIGTADEGADPFTVGAVFGLNGFLYDTSTTDVSILSTQCR